MIPKSHGLSHNLNYFDYDWESDYQSIYLLFCYFESMQFIEYKLKTMYAYLT